MAGIRKKRILAAIALVLMLLSPSLIAFSELPDQVYLKAGGATELNLALPVKAELSEGALSVISGFDQSINDLNTDVTLTAGSVSGEGTLTFKLLGFIPIKTVTVTVQAERVLMPGGQSIGVAILTEGVIVVGSSDIGGVQSPARVAGVKSGDRIVSVNGVRVESAKMLTELLQDGEEATLSVMSINGVSEVNVTPVLDSRDGVFRLGVWVRDSTAGIGTLTFAENDTFGALGHAITDVDTGILLPVGEGGIYKSAVVDINKGLIGEPGELLGQFFDAESQMGEIRKNTNFGIFGSLAEECVNPLYPEGLPMGARSEIDVGHASILTTLEGGDIREYAIEIVKLNDMHETDTRSMLIEVTDPELLMCTGGIVQGMSGSPIIQNGMLVGAVTHVLVNDPTRGYGISMESMISAADAND